MVKNFFLLVTFICAASFTKAAQQTNIADERSWRSDNRIKVAIAYMGHLDACLDDELFFFTKLDETYHNTLQKLWASRWGSAYKKTRKALAWLVGLQSFDEELKEYCFAIDRHLYDLYILTQHMALTYVWTLRKKDTRPERLNFLYLGQRILIEIENPTLMELRGAAYIKLAQENVAQFLAQQQSASVSTK